MVEDTRKPHFRQVCVWPGVTLGPVGANHRLRPKQFVKFMSREFNRVRVQYLGEVQVNGDRSDLVFAVHDEDVAAFAVPRLTVGIRWVEDVLASCNRPAAAHKRELRHLKTW